MKVLSPTDQGGNLISNVADPMTAQDAATRNYVDTRTHNSLLGLTTGDPHTQYVLEAGRPAGQTITGGTSSAGGMTLRTTSHATKGKILFGTSAYDEATNRLGIGFASPTAALHIKAGTATASTAPLKLTTGTNLTTPEVGAVEFDGTYYYVTV